MDAYSNIGKKIVSADTKKSNDCWPLGAVWPSEILWDEDPPRPFDIDSFCSGTQIAFHIPAKAFGQNPERFTDLSGDRLVFLNDDGTYAVPKAREIIKHMQFHYMYCRIFIRVCNFIWNCKYDPTWDNPPNDEGSSETRSRGRPRKFKKSTYKRKRKNDDFEYDDEEEERFLKDWNKRVSDLNLMGERIEYIPGVRARKGGKFWIETRIQACEDCEPDRKCNMCMHGGGVKTPHAADYLLVFFMDEEEAVFRNMCRDAILHIIANNRTVIRSNSSSKEDLSRFPRTTTQWNKFATCACQDILVQSTGNAIRSQSIETFVFNPYDAFCYERNIKIRNSRMHNVRLKRDCVRWRAHQDIISNTDAFLNRYLPNVDIVSRRSFTMVLPLLFYDSLEQSMETEHTDALFAEMHSIHVEGAEREAQNMSEPIEHMKLNRTIDILKKQIDINVPMKIEYLFPNRPNVTCDKLRRCIRVMLSDWAFWQYEYRCNHKESYISTTLKAIFMAIEQNDYNVIRSLAIRNEEYNDLPEEDTPVLEHHYTDLSSFGNYMVHITDDMVFHYQVDPDHILPGTLLISTAYDAYRYGLDYHLNLMFHSSEGSTGKSFLVEVFLKNFLLENSIRHITRTSECYNSIQRIGPDDDEIQFFDELQVADVHNKTGAGDPQWKERKTTMRNHSYVLGFDKNQRTQERLMYQNVCAGVTCTNMDISKLENAVYTRYLIIAVNRMHMQNALHKRNRACIAQKAPNHISNMHKQMHWFHIQTAKMIQTGAMDPVTTIIDAILVSMLRDLLFKYKNLDKNLSPREYGNLTCIARTHAVSQLWITHFGTPGGAFFGKDATPERIRILNDQLYISVEHWLMALGQISPYLFGDTNHRIHRAIYRLWDNGGQSINAKWKRAQKTSEDIMSDGRKQHNGPTEESLLNATNTSDPDYNYVMFGYSSMIRESDIINRFAIVIRAEILRDQTSFTPPPTIEQIENVLKSWLKTSYTGCVVEKYRKDPVESPVTPQCKPLKPGCDRGYRLVETEKFCDMICTIHPLQGIAFMTSFLKETKSICTIVEEFAYKIAKRNNGATLRTLKDAGLTDRQLGTYPERSVLYGNTESLEPHLFRHFRLSKDNIRETPFKIQYDILAAHIDEEKLKIIFDDPNVSSHKILEWPYSLDQLAILSRQRTLGMGHDSCNIKEYYEILRRCAFPLHRRNQLEIATTYMCAHIPNIVVREVNQRLNSNDSKVWDTAPWPTIMIWAYMMDKPATALYRNSSWKGNENVDINFRLGAVQSKAASFLANLFNHPKLSLREWFHTPEAQHFIAEKAVRDSKKDTIIHKFYKASRMPYHQRIKDAQKPPRFTFTKSTSNTHTKSFEESKNPFEDNLSFNSLIGRKINLE